MIHSTSFEVDVFLCFPSWLMFQFVKDLAETAHHRAAAGSSFSLVSMLNVLDRCASPERLLRAAHRLAPKGHLLLVT